MRLDVHELESRKVPFDAAYHPGSIDLSGSKFEQAGDLRIAGWAEMAGPSEEIRVSGHISGRLSRECDRCLETAALDLDQDFDLLYVPAAIDNDATDHAIDEAESDIGYYEGDGLGLADVLTEQVLLWLPMHWTCREDCKGICPACGANRNAAECDCRSEVADERFAALKDFHPSARK